MLNIEANKKVDKLFASAQELAEVKLNMVNIYI